MFGNIEGLYPNNKKKKIDMLRERAKINNAFIIALTESHLKSRVIDAEITITGFQLFRADRDEETRKGGVIVYVKECFANGLRVLTTGCNSVVEWVVIYLPVIHLVVVNVYRPPNCREGLFIEVLRIISNSINQIGSPMPLVMMCGDYNFPNVSWDLGVVRGGTVEQQRQAEALMTFTDNYCLYQCIEEPTRLQNILDLFFINDKTLITDIKIKNINISDHKLILVGTCIKLQRLRECNLPKKSGFAAFNYWHSSTNWDNINAELYAIDWTSCVDQSPDNILKYIESNLMSICLKNIRKKGSKSQISIIPRDRRILMRRRGRISEQLIRGVNEEQAESLYRRIEIIEDQLLESHRKEEKDKEEKAISTIRSNSKYFFAYAKRKSTIKVPVGPLEVDGELVSDAQRMSCVLQKHYQTMFSVPMYQFNNNHENPYIAAPLVMECMDITEREIKLSIKQIPEGSAPGPDGIPPILLKKCVDTLSFPIMCLWRSSFKNEFIPQILKLGLIVPIYKSGPRTEPKNYRPVTLTSHIIKLFERVLVKRLVSYLTENNLYNENQHGFRANRSCLSQLLEHHQRLLNVMETGYSADVIYLDFAKAFDKVDHGILIRKLGEIGIGGQMLGWFKQFLSNRKQAVTIEGEMSGSAEVVSEIPQGTVLRPMMFLIFISDIDTGLEYSKASSFADDTRVMLKVKNDLDTQRLQNDLDSIYEWTRINNMALNGDKFEYMRYEG